MLAEADAAREPTQEKPDENISKIVKALVQFREKLVQPSKDAINPFTNSKYVTLDKVIKAIDNALKGTGLTYTQELIVGNGMAGVKTTLLLDDEQMAFGPTMLPVDKRTAQGYGSTFTYAKRYELSAIFGVTSEEDDDGNISSSAQPKKNKSHSNNNYQQQGSYSQQQGSYSQQQGSYSQQQAPQPPQHSQEYERAISLTKSLTNLVGPDMAKELGDMARVKSGAKETQSATDKQLKILNDELQTMLMEKQNELKKSEEVPQ